VTVDLRLNEPRFVKLPDIMKDKTTNRWMSFRLMNWVSLTENNLQFSAYTPPPVREKGIMVEDTAQLVAELKTRGLV